MTGPDTLVAFLLDKSGSMSDIKQPTMEAFNAYVRGLRDTPVRFTLVQFDSLSIETTWRDLPINDVGVLGNDNYNPQGGTPLIDAAFKTIKAVERKVAEFATPPKVVICIQTDGQENSSREHSWDGLNALIKEKIGLGWQFNFMGAGIDAYQQSQRMGLSVAQTMSYDSHDLGATRAAFRESASNAALYASGASMNTEYSAAQKMAAKDAFVPVEDRTSAHPNGPHIVNYAPVMKRAPVKGHVDDIEI